MKKKISKVGLVLACTLIPVGAMGFGYFVGQDNLDDKKVASTLTVDGDINGTIVDMKESDVSGIVPGDTIDKTINIQPNATAPSLLRVKIVPSWDGGDSNDELSTSNIKFLYEGDVKQAFNEVVGNYWYKNNDGYLYYMNSVKTEENVMKLVKGIQFLGGSDDTDAQEYQGKNLKITVTMDMIQCKYAPFKTKWEIPSDSTLYSKLKDLCPDADKYIK